MQKSLIKNRHAFHDFEIMEKFETGIVLKGHEVKSLKSGGGHLTGTFVLTMNGEVFVEHLHIPLYGKTTLDGYNPDLRRKLLLHKNEIIKIAAALATKGVTVIPLEIYLEHGHIKMEIAIARGKKLYDKRESLKKRDLKRHIETSLKNY